MCVRIYLMSEFTRVYPMDLVNIHDVTVLQQKRCRKPILFQGAQWLSGRVLYSKPKGWGLSLTSVTALCPLARHINPSLPLVQPRKTRPYITESLLMGCKESKVRYLERKKDLAVVNNYRNLNRLSLQITKI